MTNQMTIGMNGRLLLAVMALGVALVGCEAASASTSVAAVVAQADPCAPHVSVACVPQTTVSYVPQATVQYVPQVAMTYVAVQPQVQVAPITAKARVGLFERWRVARSLRGQSVEVAAHQTVAAPVSVQSMSVQPMSVGACLGCSR